MKTLSTVALAMSLIFAAPAFAVDEHHPEKGAAVPESAAPAPNVPATVKKMQHNVKKMQAQVDQIGKAKTDEARQKAMDEHMKTMQENMHLARGMMMDEPMDCSKMHGAMKDGKGHGGGSHDRMLKMEKRMEMMEQKMQGQHGAVGQTPAN
jgi:hypothetical protein